MAKEKKHRDALMEELRKGGAENIAISGNTLTWNTVDHTGSKVRQCQDFDPGTLMMVEK